MRYIATRPRVERHGEHGLFSGRSVSLNAALREVEGHTGNVWTFIWSLRREDAARLRLRGELAEADQCTSGGVGRGHEDSTESAPLVRRIP